MTIYPRVFFVVVWFIVQPQVCDTVCVSIFLFGRGMGRRCRHTHTYTHRAKFIALSARPVGFYVVHKFHAHQYARHQNYVCV